MMNISEHDMGIAAMSFCMPMTLVINFSLFQYLLVMYYKRRREIRGALLLLCAFLGFATLVPFSFPNDMIVGHLNDISETSSVLTFLIQITIICRDINKKIRIPTLRYLTYVSEVLILLNLIVVAINFVEVMHVDVAALDGFDNIMENVSLVFIFTFRFTMLAMAKGVTYIRENKKFEITMYLLFVTHEYPFIALEKSSNVSWEDVQALWNRLTIALCVGITIQEKLRSKFSGGNTKMSSHTTMGGPKEVEIAPASWNSRKMLGALSFRSQVRPALPAVTVASLKVVSSRGDK
ncbi:hypothetical protein PybrP1_012164 [[Pythium] brassicae (nom. inval.)]|nr:hypothetical protein PybrP1_012164 [[Pythium] brassicae (nom. inval.)]